MRTRAYRLFELLAWPVLVWCTLELGLRAALHEGASAGAAAILALAAAGTVVGCRARCRQLLREG